MLYVLIIFREMFRVFRFIKEVRGACLSDTVFSKSNCQLDYVLNRQFHGCKPASIIAPDNTLFTNRKGRARKNCVVIQTRNKTGLVWDYPTGQFKEEEIRE